MSISTLCFSGSFERSGHTWTQFQTQCNLWTRKNKPISCKLSEAARSNNLFCLCLGLNLSKSMAQLHCCCRLTQAEISGIEDSRCVCGESRASMKFSWLHTMSISTFERSGHTWTHFQTQCNLWTRKNKPDAEAFLLASSKAVPYLLGRKKKDDQKFICTDAVLRLWHCNGQLQQVLAVAPQAVVLCTVPEQTEGESKQGRRCPGGPCQHK